MSKFIVSNKQEDIKKVVSHNGIYPIKAEWDALGAKCVVFDKRAQHHDDSLWNGQVGAFVVGTPMFKDGLSDLSISRYVFDHTSEEGIAKLKTDIVGYWAALVIKEDAIYIFNDYYGIYDVCYTINDGVYCVGCELADVARGKNHLEFEEYPFIMENFQMGAFPGETPFKGIKKLTADKYLKIGNGRISEICLKTAKISYFYKDETTAVKDIATLIKTYARLVAEKYHSVLINMTGGLDSRLMFAAFNAVDADITFAHGVHSGGQTEDGTIVKQLSEAYQKPLELMDWEQPRMFCLKNQEEVFDVAGFKNYLALGCKQHFDMFYKQAKLYPFNQSGYFCEAIRLREWAEKKGETFSLIDYVDNYFIDKNLETAYVHYEAYRNYLIEKYKNQLLKIGYDGDIRRIPINYFERFRWQMSRYHDSRSVVNDNMNHYHFSLLAVPYIHEAILSLPADVIRGGSFQIKVIEELDANLLNFDVFSHRRSFYIKNYKKVHKLTKKNLVDILFADSPALKRMLINVYQRVKYDAAKKKNLMADQIKGLDVNMPTWFDIDAYEGSLVRLRAMAIGIHCLEKQF